MLTGVVTFLLVLIGLLAIPLTLTYQLSWRQKFQSNIKLLWLFGLVRLQLSPFQSKVSAKDSEPASKSRVSSRRSRNKKINPVTMIRQKPFRRRLFRFMQDVWYAIHKHNINLRIRVGLGDPADTGQLWALVGPISTTIATAQEASIEIEPEFFEPTFELDSGGSLRLIPLQIIYLIVALLLSPPVWRGIKQMRKTES